MRIRTAFLGQASPLMLIGGVAGVHILLAGISFFKDVAFAAAFGTTPAADLLNLSFLLPEAVSYNLLAAVIGVAAVPELSRLWGKGSREAFVRCCVRLSAHSVIVMTAAGILLWIFQASVGSLLGFTQGEASAGGFETYYRLLLFSLPLFPLFAIGSAALMAVGSFYTAAAGPIAMNGLMLAAAAASAAGWLPSGAGTTVYACSILAGAAAMTVWMWAVLWRRLLLAGVKRGEIGRRARRMAAERNDGGLKRIYRDFLPMLLITLCVQSVYAAERMMAAHLKPGTLAGLNYAYRVSQFPNWVFVAAVTSVLLPAMARASSDAGPAEAERFRSGPTLFRTIRLLLAALIPAALGLYLCREWVVELLFARGSFGEDSARVTSGLLAGYALAIAGQGVSTVCTRMFLAEGALYPTVGIYVLSAACTLGLDVLLVPRFGAAALGYGAFAGWTVNALLMTGLAARYSKQRRGLHGNP